MLKQVVPQIGRLKNKYDLLWEQKSPEGYLKIMAVLQKFIDQGISVNTSYNPLHYDEEKIPLSLMMQHMLMFYKYGGKQLYYNNTYDGAGEITDERDPPVEEIAEGTACDWRNPEDCDACKI